MATWLSRLERACALTVAVYVILSIGWPFVVIAVAMHVGANNHFIGPFIMGTPLFGTLFGTQAVAEGPVNLPGGAASVWTGCYLWMAGCLGAAAGLYALTVATFDDCLGRMSELVEEWSAASDRGLHALFVEFRMSELVEEWSAAGGFAEESRALAQKRHDFAQLAQGGSPVAGGAPIGGLAPESGQGGPVN